MGNSAQSVNRETLDTWCRRVWEEQGADAINELFEDDGIAGGLGRKELAGPP